MKIQEYKQSELYEMSNISIYLLLEERGADVFGLWSASKPELMNAYKRQIGFRA